MLRIYQSQPKLHRGLVSTVDEGDFTAATPGVVTRGYRECRFDVDLEGADIESLEVTLLFYNMRLDGWFYGSSFTFGAAGKYAITAETRGATVFLAVTGFSGGEFQFSADYCLS